MASTAGTAGTAGIPMTAGTNWEVSVAGISTAAKTASTPMTAATPGTAAMAGVGSVVQALMPRLPCVRTGEPAAAMAAGLVDVWSTIRLLTMRGSVSKTFPFFCAYDELAGPGLGPKKSVGAPCAVKNFLEPSRGKIWSAEPNVSWPG